MTNGTIRPIEALIPHSLRGIPPGDLPKAIPSIAKDEDLATRLQTLASELHTNHHVLNMDARLWDPPESSAHLVLTSPPYWNIKDYPCTQAQLGNIQDYREFVENLAPVWEQCRTALVPGGRLICVVGDVCLSRKRNKGKHSVIPLHASIQEQCRRIGFDNLTPILWYKVTNAVTESGENQGPYMGKPYEPGGIIKNDVEFILMFRKPGGYRAPSQAQRLLSVIPTSQHKLWFRQVWQDIPGTQTRQHPAPYPLKLAERLIRMFSFADDTVVDPFCGTGTTLVAAKRWGRHSVGIDVEPTYCRIAQQKLKRETK